MIFVGLVFLVAHEFELYLLDLEVWVKSLSMFAPLGFILLFMLLTPVFVSVDALCFAAGVLFPIVTGAHILAQLYVLILI